MKEPTKETVKERLEREDKEELKKVNMEKKVINPSYLYGFVGDIIQAQKKRDQIKIQELINLYKSALGGDQNIKFIIEFLNLYNNSGLDSILKLRQKMKKADRLELFNLLVDRMHNKKLKDDIHNALMINDKTKIDKTKIYKKNTEPKNEVKEIKQKIEEKKFVVEPKKEVVKDIIKAPEVIEKVGKFSYDKNYFTELDKIAKTDRLGNNQEKIQMKNNLMNLQFSNDLFTTPQECINSIFNDILETNTYLEYLKSGFNILEPSAGTGMFIRHIIDLGDKLKINNLDANEYSPDLVKILKEKTKISNVYNKDFLNFKQDKEYQLIIMNPPYSQYIDGKDENKAYLFHLIKAMLIKSGYEKQIYIICPELPNDLESGIQKAIAERIAKKFNLKYDKDEGLDLPFHQINKIGECSGFIKYVKGRTTKMNQKFYMYNLVVRD